VFSWKHKDTRKYSWADKEKQSNEIESELSYHVYEFFAWLSLYCLRDN
jgi:hypothetical protein